MPSVLVLEDEENLRLSIAKRLGALAGTVEQAGSLSEARAKLGERAFDLVVTDVNLPDGDGVALVKELHASGSGTDAIVVTAYGTVEHAVDAMRHGAADYLQKPLRLDELALVVERVLERRRDRARLAAYERAETSEAAEARIVGEDPAWREAIDAARRFAEAHAEPGEEGPLPAILITGETGSGKGVAARLIHDVAVRTAGRESAPFVQVNCAALPAEQVETELFGREASASESARAGYFELAEGGTIFLDEIAEMSAELQAKLLLVMESGLYRRVGGTSERRARARVATATNQDLSKRVSEGSFREDLYYRLGAFRVDLPPLRARGTDAVRLAEATLERAARERGRAGLSFSKAALERIGSHPWRGNARELINAVQRAVILCQGDAIEPSDLAIEDRAAPAARPAGKPGELVIDFDHGPHTIEEVERTLIEQALARSNGNVTKAARLIGMPRGSFRYRMEKAGLSGMS